MAVKNTLSAGLKLAKTKLPTSVAAALLIETEIEATECRMRCPVWNPARPVPKGHAPGSLRASIHIEGPFFEGNVIRTSVVAGGVSAPYAIYVHEDLTAHHATGEAKFIEGPLYESRPYIAERVAKRVRFG